MTLTCDSCGAAMERFQRGEVWIWSCDSCGAHALTSASLRRVVPAPVWEACWPVIRKTTQRGERVCPVCRGAMDVTPPLERASGIRIDVCDPCQLIWFDPSEFTRFPKRPVPKEFSLPPALARELAMAEVELMNLQYDEREGRVTALVEKLMIGILQSLALVGSTGRK